MAKAVAEPGARDIGVGWLVVGRDDPHRLVARVTQVYDAAGGVRCLVALPLRAGNAARSGRVAGFRPARAGEIARDRRPLPAQDPPLSHRDMLELAHDGPIRPVDRARALGLDRALDEAMRARVQAGERILAELRRGVIGLALAKHKFRALAGEGIGGSRLDRFYALFEQAAATAPKPRDTSPFGDGPRGD